MTEILKRMDRAIAWLSRQITSAFLLLIVLVVLYSVLLRYVFDAPPFWTDRIGVFANMAMVLIGLSITVRNRELIAMQGLYEKISKNFALGLETMWNVVILIFALMFTWYGADAAANMPGQYWDFQEFCIDLSFGDEEAPGPLLTAIKLVESVIGAMVRPFCVDGAVPQRYLAMLMPISGVLIVLASVAVLIEDIRKISASRKKDDASPGGGD
jgi:TRAP-type C4-dicarboxylate transport system permease small subunit